MEKRHHSGWMKVGEPGPKKGTGTKKTREATKERLIALLRETDPRVGRSSEDLADELGETLAETQAILNGMNRNRRAAKVMNHMSEEEPKWTIYTGMIAPPDEEGAKTKVERDVVDLLKETALPMPVAQIAGFIQVPSGQTAAVCQGLVRRDVIRVAMTNKHIVEYELP